ncbi:TPA_asm: coat protein [ssRNA phage EMS014]|uniref:Coat protein n=2 Tax=Fiersviridae TaxID=2842319 RepID=A0A8S5KXQ0_9VIRU|nr:coat protein [ssRNA phage EMS014]DAD49871.1 TPA_asm: coat protein [ssRNA phage EMS014]
MPAMTNIVLRDDQTSVATKTLIPIVSDGNMSVWRENAANVPIDGQIKLTGQWERMKDGTYRLNAKLEVPVMETAGAGGAYVAPPKVAYKVTASLTLYAPSRSTIADRANAMKMLSAVLCGADATAGTTLSPQSVTGDAWKNSALPFVFGFINQAFPT